MFGLQLAQLEPLDLAGGRFGQVIDDLDPAGIFPWTDLGLHVVLQGAVDLLAPCDPTL